MDRERGSLCPSGSHPRDGAPTRDGPAPNTGGAWRGLCVAVAIAAVAMVSPVAWTGGPAGASGARPRPLATSSSTAAPALLLDEQTPWVAPGQQFDLKLRTGHTSVPTSQLGLSVTVYNCLTSVSEFDQSVTSSLPSGGQLTSTRAPIPLSSLPTTATGQVDLSMPVTVGAATTAPGTFTIQLAASGGGCPSPAGVYPVRVELVNLTSGQSTGGFTTHLVYTDAAPGTQRLQVALVLPLHATVGPATAPTPHQLVEHPSAALAPLSAADAAGVVGTVDSMASRHGAVPLTLQASPQTIDALQGSSATRATVAQLAAMAADPSDYQFASSPFTPVNASALVAAGLSSELALQISRGTSLLAALTSRPVGDQSATGGLGAWITDDTLDNTALDQLQANGYSQVVVPSGSVASPPTNGSAVEPFTVVPGRGPAVTAVAASADLTQRFSGSPGDPVLAAHQLVAELAQIYYEKPNDDTPRATVALAPTSWSDDPAFVDALLDALTANPIIQPVTVSQLFAAIPTDTSCHQDCRLTGGGGAGGLPAAAIHRQRQQVDGFSSATGGTVARVVGAQLGDVVLAGESESLRPGQQAAVLRNAGLAVDAQLGQLTLDNDRTVTLTSQTGTLQVTIVSSAPYPVRATLTLTSDKLLFPNGTSQWTEQTSLLPAVSGAAHTNVVPVAVRARTSGVFNVDIVMHSPSYQLELASGQVSVRSTATSVVGIILSLGALAVLVVWWVRTSLRRRRQRRAEGDPAVPAPGAG